jgi:hypothetical protein
MFLVLAQGIEHLPNKLEVLNSNPSTTTTIRKILEHAFFIALLQV